MGRNYDIAVIGAGAAGLTAAIFAKKTAPDARVVALDGAPRIGAKILISGGGRCNVTHDAVTTDDFNGSRNAIAKVLRSFTVDETVAWFASMGVTLKREETGKLFPTTDRARTVVDALLRECGPETIVRHRVEKIERGFVIDDEITAKRVILATGGRSVPKTGSDGRGYELARALGHTVTDTFPALVPLVLPRDFWTAELSGTSVLAELSVRASTGRVLHRATGSLLFTHFGLSGPVALDISRHWLAARRDDRGVTLTASFLVGETFESLERELLEVAKANPRATPGSVFRGRLPERLLERLIEGPDGVDDAAGRDARRMRAGRPPSGGSVASLSKEERRRMIRALLETMLPVERDRGFDYAEVTAGGVPLSEVDVATMQSRVCEGLYLCGEILDVDGKIGGYNFQWAWASGRLAGIHSAR
jgi:predicted Rossmann fold flavoprotein